MTDHGAAVERTALGKSDVLTSGTASKGARLAGELSQRIRPELPLVAGALTTLIFYTAGASWLKDLTNPFLNVVLFLWLFSVMLWSAFSVVRHAEHLAEQLGEPYGTLILTFAVTTIEVALITAIMLTGERQPTLARDTMLAVFMIVLNGLVGLALLIGGFRHLQQDYNLEGARAYLAVLIPLATMSLILPRFTVSTEEPTLDAFQAPLFAAITIALYITFLALQTSRHRSFFRQPGGLEVPEEEDVHTHIEPRSLSYHAILLVLTMLPIVLLSKKLAVLIEDAIATFGAPAALGGVAVAFLVLTPEGLAALRAAVRNQLQRAVNICLGSALATIGLTVSAVLLISTITGKTVVLGLGDTDMVLLILTLILSMLTFGGVRTNMLQGAVHMTVFLVYLVLIFEP